MTTKDPEPTFGHRSVKRFKNHHAHVTVEVSGLPSVSGWLTGGLFTPDKVAFSLRLGVDGEWKSEPIHPCELRGPADMSFGERDYAPIDRETPWLSRLIAEHADRLTKAGREE